MSLSTLAGTKWLINLEPTLNTTAIFEINFIANEEEYNSFEMFRSPLSEIDYGIAGITIPVYSNNKWDNDNNRTIEIIDGDVANSSLISWLEDNAVQIMDTHEVNITYGSSSIATLDASGSTILLTSGKQCNNNIVIEYTRPSASLQSKSTTPTTSTQTITPDSGYDGLSQVSVSAIPSYYGNTQTDTAAAADLLANKKAHTYSNGAAVQITGTMIDRGTVSKTLDATSGNQSYAIPSGKHSGSGTVNIVLEEKTATPSESSQNITPTSGKVLSKVAINAVSSTYVGSGVTKKSAQTYTPGTSDQTIAASQYLTGAQTISGDANLVAENIADGVSIFGVTGTHSGGGSQIGNPVTVTGTNLVQITDDNKSKWLENFVVTIPYRAGGESQCIITRAGKNLFPTKYPIYGINGSVGSSGITSGSSYKTFAIRCKVNTDYRFQQTTKWTWSVAFGDKLPKVGDSISYMGTMASRTSVTWNSGNHTYLLLSPNNAGYVNAAANEVRIWESSSDATYEAWNGDEWVINFPFTIYGGTLNVLTGELTSRYNSSGTQLATPITYNVDKHFPTFEEGINTFSVSIPNGQISLTYVPVSSDAKTIADEAKAAITNVRDHLLVERHGISYRENMVIPAIDGSYTAIGTPRYIREQFQAATGLKSYVQQYGTPATDTDYGIFRGCSNLETVWVARASFTSNYCFEGCNALKHIILGRIGLAVTGVRSGIFNGSSMTHIEDITVYVNATDLSGVPANVKDRITPSHSSGAVITYKNYESGETIATVTVP